MARLNSSRGSILSGDEMRDADGPEGGFWVMPANKIQKRRKNVGIRRILEEVEEEVEGYRRMLEENLIKQGNVIYVYYNSYALLTGAGNSVQAIKNNC